MSENRKETKECDQCGSSGQAQGEFCHHCGNRFPDVLEVVDADVVRQENADLVKRIKDLCKKSRGPPEVVLLFGLSGVGKSSVINTVIKALTGTYIPIAQPGEGLTASKTLELDRFEQCGIADENMDDEEFKQWLHRLPTIYDCAGMGDIDTPEVSEILQMVLQGFIPPGVLISHLEELMTKYGVGCLKEIYTERNPEWQVTKVVFVHACSVHSIPKQLFACLDSVLKMADQSTGTRIAPCQVFVMTTKYDLVRDHSLAPLFGNEAASVSLAEYKKVQQELATVCSLEGAEEDFFVKWVSFVGGKSKDNPYIDNIALKFVEKIMMYRDTRRLPGQHAGEEPRISEELHDRLIKIKQEKERQKREENNPYSMTNLQRMLGNVYQHVEESYHIALAILLAFIAVMYACYRLLVGNTVEIEK